MVPEPLHCTTPVIEPPVQLKGPASVSGPASVPPLRFTTPWALPVPAPPTVRLPLERLSVCVPLAPPSVRVLTDSLAVTVTV